MPESKITIRSYRTSDKGTVLNLFELNTPTYFAHEEQKEFSYYLDHEIEEYFVVESEKKILASGGINYEDNKHTGIISWDMVDPGHQGKGIGSKLLKYRIELLKLMPIVNKIKVRTTQLTFVFYEKHGFTLVKTEKDYWYKGLDLYEMEISISYL